MKTIRPSRLRVEASAACQLQCPLCPIHSGVERPAIGNGFLKLRDLEKLLDENPYVRQVELANYGEIFLNPEMLGILRSAHERGVVLTADEGVNLNTVKPEVLEGLVKYRVESLSCSIDGVSDDVYRQYRKGGNLSRVLDHIRTINALKEEYGSPVPRLEWQFVVFGHNEHQIAQARALAAELNMEFRLKLSWDPIFSPITDEEAVRRELGVASVVEYRQSLGRHYDELNCHRMWTDPQINWNGAVLGCTRNFWGEFGGNAFTDGLDAAVNSPGMVYARQMLLGKKPARDDIPCATCDIYQYRKGQNRWVPRMRVDQGFPFTAARSAHRNAKWLYRGVPSPRQASGAMTRAGSAPEAAPGAAGGALHNRVYPLTLPLPDDPNVGWRITPLFSGHTRGLQSWSCHATTQAKGTRPHPLHNHKEEEILIVLEGAVDVLVPERRVPLRRGQVAYYPSLFPHTVEAAGEGGATYLALSWKGHKRIYSPVAMRFGVFDLDFDYSPEGGFGSRLVFRQSTGYLTALQCHTTVVEPGSGQDVHEDAYDVFHIVLRGGVKTIGHSAGTDDVMVYAEGEPHGMHNAGAQTAHLLALEFETPTLGLPGRIFYLSLSAPFRGLRAARRSLRLRTRLRSFRRLRGPD